MSEVTRIRVSTDAPYDVVVGWGVHDELPAVLGDEVRRVAVIASGALRSTAATIVDVVAGHGYEPLLIDVPDAEQAKTSTVAAFCWSELGQAGFTRSDAVVSVGGGATTDLAGFVAATFLRGLRVVHVPTTVLAMVDAAVGGKTGINTAEGKNLVGAIHEPAGVLCDLSHLQSLPAADVASGLAEVVKCGFIADESILSTVESDPAASLDPSSSAHRELIEAAIRVKATVVARDLRESTSQGRQVGREALNYGHTFAHAVERAEKYTVRHGDAVSVGLVYVAELARLAGRLDLATAARHSDVLESLGLPTRYTGSSWPELHAAMRVDKKSRGDTLRFVVIERVGAPAILAGPDPDLLTAAYAEVAR
ncbi:MAG TPA: 3-dehydroquinate synthase [Nocardioidaceae bacterium]|nr:3-dehydroquinate synthase [Nocardioidaceae bacterium]